MERQADKREQSVLRNIDWWTVLIYIALLSFGWISVCGASYSYGETDIFSLSTRSGMQIVWIGTSILLGFVIVMLDDRFYDTFAYIIYALLLRGDFDISGFLMHRGMHVNTEETYKMFKESQKQKREDAFNYPLFLGILYLIVSAVIAWFFL